MPCMRNCPLCSPNFIVLPSLKHLIVEVIGFFMVLDKIPKNEYRKTTFELELELESEER